MKRKERKYEKGITLVALVITIIVMLILVSVTITMAVNGGLFGYAQNAVVETEAAKEQEQNIGSGLIKVTGVFDQDTQIDDIVDYYKSTN